MSKYRRILADYLLQAQHYFRHDFMQKTVLCHAIKYADIVVKKRKVDDGDIEGFRKRISSLFNQDAQFNTHLWQTV